MSDARILIVTSAIDSHEAAAALQMLMSTNVPNSTKYLAAVGKLDSQKPIKTTNVEARYPTEPVHLQTLCAWAEVSLAADSRFRDGYDLFCLRTVLGNTDPCDYVVLLRDASDLHEHLAEIEESGPDRLFVTWPCRHADAENFIVKADHRMTGLLDLAWGLYESGGAYAMLPYSLDHVLTAAATTQRLEQQFRSHPS